MSFVPFSWNTDYGASSEGDIYSRKSGEWKKLNPQMDSTGYLQVRIYDETGGKLMFVHRLVASIYLSNPKGYKEVNHIDGDKTNNSVSNLEWCSRRDNIMHAHNTGLVKTRTPVVAINVHNGRKFTFSGQHEAARQMGLNQGNINHALKRGGTTGGYRFAYLEEDSDEIQ